MREFEQFIESDGTGAALNAFCEAEKMKDNSFSITCIASATKPRPPGLIVSYINSTPCDPPALPRRI